MTGQELRDDFSRTSIAHASAELAARINRRGHACARCGRYAHADQMVYSRWTKNRYCGDGDLEACAKRAKRRANLGPKAVAQ